jgi:hypothetical protein
MKTPKQLFFRHDEREEALQAGRMQHRHLFALVDRRSNNPTPRMYVLGLNTLNQMRVAGMFKRMWIAREVED